jgi:HlyD family secretion protein
MKKWIIIIVVIVLIGAIVGANFLKEDGGTSVSVEEVKKGTVVKHVTGSGQIKPAVEVKISANVSGKIIKLTAQEGDSVSKGQLLVELESEQYEASLQRAESSLLAAIANEKQAHLEYERKQKLFQQKLISPAEFEAAEANAKATEGTRLQMEASRDEAADQLRKTRLYSTMDGVVTKLNKEQGEIAIGATFQEDVIMTVADLSVMESVIEVDENEIVSIILNDTCAVELDAFPDTSFKGQVTEIANSVITKGLGTQEQVTNFEVTVTIQNADKRFRPGMSTTVDVFTDREEEVFRVPIQSVTVREKNRLEKKKDVEDPQPENPGENKKKDEEKIEVVFIVKEKSVEAVPVKLGISDDTHYAVLSGLEEGNKIVTGPFKAISKTLNHGDRVQIKESE